MSAPEAVATPVVVVEEVKPAESVSAPEPSAPAVEAPKPEETTQSSDKDVTKVEPAQESVAEPSTNPEATPTVTEEAKTEVGSADAKKEDQPRSPSLLAKILAPFKGRIPRSPKKEKKEEAKLPEDTTVKASEAVATEETPAEAVVEPAQPTSEPVAPETPAEPAADDTEAPKKEVKEEKKPEKRDVKLISRRLSARVTDLFKSKKAEASTPSKVVDNPPVIEEHTPVAPLENPAAEETPVPAEEPKPEVPPVAAVVAAAA